MNESVKRLLSGITYIIIMFICTNHSKSSLTILFIVLGVISLYEILALKQKKKLFALLYVLVPFTLIQLIIHDTYKTINSKDLILFMLILTWVFDTFAYIIGKKIGKNKIKPSISPKKSWEGFAGGFIFTFITSYLTFNYFEINSKTLILTLTIILPFSATFGDFIASYFKRKAGVKDTGKLIPGHGGIIDRMDAFMITIPILYVLTKIF